MQQLLIPLERARLLSDKKFLEEICKRLDCKIEVESGEVVIEGEAYNEFIARNVIHAFARGFEMRNACKLLKDDYFFRSIDLKELFRSEEKLHRMLARIIGREGKTKTYIESVSGADIAIYGNTVSSIGTVEQLRIAEIAINVLIEGGMHSKAYRLMEKARKDSDRVWP